MRVKVRVKSGCKNKPERIYLLRDNTPGFSGLPAIRVGLGGCMAGILTSIFSFWRRYFVASVGQLRYASKCL